MPKTRKEVEVGLWISGVPPKTKEDIHLCIRLTPGWLSVYAKNNEFYCLAKDFPNHLIGKFRGPEVNDDATYEGRIYNKDGQIVVE